MQCGMIDRSEFMDRCGFAPRGHLSGVPACIGLAVLVAFLAGSVVMAGAALGAQRSQWSFGSFAGYVWRGHVASVRGSWSVPSVLVGPMGSAGAWIGAQAPGSPGAFVQIGTTEERVRPFALGASGTIYYAFWSDVANHFHPRALFLVHPGDDISTSLRLAGGRWTIAIVDRTSGAAKHFSTNQEARASFNQAEWVQEDPRDELTGKPLPYPRLSTVRFRRLAVNSRTPAYADLYSQWMSASGSNWAPSPLRRDSFAVHRATVSPAGAQYLHIAAEEDAAASTFAALLAGWTVTTPGSQIASASSAFAVALKRAVHALASSSWPKHVRRLIRALIHSSRVLLHQSQSVPSTSSASLSRWTLTWKRDASVTARIGHIVRRALKVPELTPTH